MNLLACFNYACRQALLGNASGVPKVTMSTQAGTASAFFYQTKGDSVSEPWLHSA